MAEFTDEELHELSDEELEAAFKAARSAESNQASEEEGVDAEAPDENDDEAEDDSAEDADESDEGEGEDTEEKQTGSGSEQLGDQASSPDSGAATEGTETPPAAAPTVRKYKANGKEFEFTDVEIFEQFPKVFGQAMDYTKKLQTIKPWRKTIDALQEASLDHADVSLMIDVLKGDKAAIAAVLKRTGVDTLDIDTENSTYVPSDHGRDSHTLALQDVITELQSDDEFAVTRNILDKEWDEDSWKVMASSPEKIQALHIDVKNGLYAKLQPKAAKLKVFDGGRKSDLDYYLEAGRAYFAEESLKQAQNAEAEHSRVRVQAAANTAAKVQTVKAEEAKRVATKETAQKRKAAGLTAKATSKAGPINYLESSDEDFEEWYKSLEN